MTKIKIFKNIYSERALLLVMQMDKALYSMNERLQNIRLDSPSDIEAIENLENDIKKMDNTINFYYESEEIDEKEMDK